MTSIETKLQSMYRGSSASRLPGGFIKLEIGKACMTLSEGKWRSLIRECDSALKHIVPARLARMKQR